MTNRTDECDRPVRLILHGNFNDSRVIAEVKPYRGRLDPPDVWRWFVTLRWKAESEVILECYPSPYRAVPVNQLLSDARRYLTDIGFTE